MIKFVCGNCGSETVVCEPTINGVVSSDNSTMKTVNLNPGVVKHNNKENEMFREMTHIEKVNAFYRLFREGFRGDKEAATTMLMLLGDNKVKDSIFKNTTLSQVSPFEKIIELAEKDEDFATYLCNATKIETKVPKEKLDERMNTFLTIWKDMQKNYEEDLIAKEIIANGYVRNTRLHRRWIMAQTMRLLGNDNEWTKRVHRWYGFDYQFTMMLEELRVLTILEKEDKESFEERAHFFTKDVVVATCENYLKQFIKYVKRAKMCENRKYGKYKRIFGKYYKINDIPNLYSYITTEMSGVKRANTVTELYEALKKFMNSAAYYRLPWHYDKSQSWIDAFKGAGSYYTLKNMIMYHNCVIFDEDNKPMTQSQSMAHLSKVLDEYQGQYWRMLALLKKVISDNNFSWKAAMDKVYNK